MPARKKSFTVLRSSVAALCLAACSWIPDPSVEGEGPIDAPPAGVLLSALQTGGTAEQDVALVGLPQAAEPGSEVTVERSGAESKRAIAATAVGSFAVTLSARDGDELLLGMRRPGEAAPSHYRLVARIAVREVDAAGPNRDIGPEPDPRRPGGGAGDASAQASAGGDTKDAPIEAPKSPSGPQVAWKDSGELVVEIPGTLGEGGLPIVAHTMSGAVVEAAYVAQTGVYRAEIAAAPGDALLWMVRFPDGTASQMLPLVAP